MSSYVGTCNCDTLNWLKVAPYTHSAAYRQPGRNGNGHTLGPKYADSSIIRTTHFVADKLAGDGVLEDACALCGDTVSVGEDAMHAATVVTTDVFVESVKPTKSNAASVTALLGYCVVLEWTVYIPVT